MMRIADVASMLVAIGLVVQVAGVYVLSREIGLPMIIIGTEIAAMGFIGVFRAR
jgi:hypothetical protein